MNVLLRELKELKKETITRIRKIVGTSSRKEENIPMDYFLKGYTFAVGYQYYLSIH